VHPIGLWSDPADDKRHIGWVRSVSDALADYRTGGVYLNFTSEETTDRVRAGYNDVTYERLVGLKNRYDPTNVFRFNQNIAPRTEAGPPDRGSGSQRSLDGSRSD
jgi:hypothetical protein